MRIFDKQHVTTYTQLGVIATLTYFAGSKRALIYLPGSTAAGLVKGSLTGVVLGLLARAKFSDQSSSQSKNLYFSAGFIVGTSLIAPLYLRNICIKDGFRFSSLTALMLGAFNSICEEISKIIKNCNDIFESNDPRRVREAEDRAEITLTLRNNFLEMLEKKGFKEEDLSPFIKEEVKAHQNSYIDRVMIIQNKELDKGSSDETIQERVAQFTLNWYKNEEQAFNQKIINQSFSGKNNAQERHKANQISTLELRRAQAKAKLTLRQAKEVVALYHQTLDEAKRHVTETEAEQNQQELASEELESAVQTTQPRKKKHKGKGKKPAPQPAPAAETAEAAATRQEQIQAQIEDEKILNRMEWVNELNQRIGLNVHPHVSRWFEPSLKKIRTWDGYQGKTNHEVGLERYKHHLPGIEKLLATPADRAVYTFPTTYDGRPGYGMEIELVVGKHKPLHGWLYTGVDPIDNTLYHSYIRFPNMETSVIQMFQDQGDGDLCPASKWKQLKKAQFDVDNNGVLTLTFKHEQHSLVIKPFREDRLNPELF